MPAVQFPPRIRIYHNERQYRIGMNDPQLGTVEIQFPDSYGTRNRIAICDAVALAQRYYETSDRRVDWSGAGLPFATALNETCLSDISPGSLFTYWGTYSKGQSYPSKPFTVLLNGTTVLPPNAHHLASRLFQRDPNAQIIFLGSRWQDSDGKYRFCPIDLDGPTKPKSQLTAFVEAWFAEKRKKQMLEPPDPLRTSPIVIEHPAPQPPPKPFSILKYTGDSPAYRNIRRLFVQPQSFDTILSVLGDRQDALLLGPKGIGKTYTGWSVVDQSITNEATFAFCNGSQDLLRAWTEGSREAFLGRMVKPNGFLFVDDLGNLTDPRALTHLGGILVELLTQAKKQRCALLMAVAAPVTESQKHFVKALTDLCTNVFDLGTIFQGWPEEDRQKIIGRFCPTIQATKIAIAQNPCLRKVANQLAANRMKPSWSVRLLERGNRSQWAHSKKSWIMYLDPRI